jgi:3-hydroxyacyl-CoA dehydrogenase/enoyl-CoA hydratase/carnithine racemase
VATAKGLAGANLNEIFELIVLKDENLIIETIERVTAIFLRFQALPFPKVCAIEGEWLGGGLEFSFYFDWRVAVSTLLKGKADAKGKANAKGKADDNDKDTNRIGLPEPKVGVIQGFGGTYFVPRLTPRLTDAVDFLTSCKKVTTKRGFELGLIDELVSSSEQLIAMAKQFCWTVSAELEKAIDSKGGDKNNVRSAEELTTLSHILSAHRQRRQRVVKRARGWQTRRDIGQALFPLQGNKLQKVLAPAIMEGSAGGRKWLGRQMQQIARDTSVVTAPLAVIELAMKARDRSLKEGLDWETKLFAREAMGHFAQGILHYFTHKGGAKDAFGHVQVPVIKKLAILGAAGNMGAGIAAVYAASAQIEKLVLIDRDKKVVEMTWSRIEKYLRKRKFDDAAVQAVRAKIVFTADYNDLADSQAIIEAVFETVEVKQEALAKIAAVKAAQAVQEPYYVFSNTSALDLDELATVLGPLAQFFCGVHFFNPAEELDGVEIVRAAQTSDETMAVGVQLVNIIDKSPMPCFNSPGFVVNRVLGPYLAIVSWLLSWGVPPDAIDKAAKHAGIVMGPTTLTDLVGADIALSVANTLEEKLGLPMPPDERNVLHILVHELKQRGKKDKAGIWLYDYHGEKVRDADGKGILNPALLKKCDWLGKNDSFSGQAIEQFLGDAVINATLNVVEEGVVAVEHLQSIDIAVVNCTSICGAYGGPTRQLDAEGVITFYRRERLISRTNEGQPWAKIYQPGKLLTFLNEQRMSFENLRQELAATGESFAAYASRKAVA